MACILIKLILQYKCFLVADGLDVGCLNGFMNWLDITSKQHFVTSIVQTAKKWSNNGPNQLCPLKNCLGKLVDAHKNISPQFPHCVSLSVLTFEDEDEENINQISKS